jgi:hypothetical protein
MTANEISLDDFSICMIGTTWSMPVEDGIEYYDVEVEHIGGTDYRCIAKTSAGDKPIDYPKYEDKPEDQTIGNWIANMQKYEIMAGHQVYYDLWNWEDNSALNKELLEEFENAKRCMLPLAPAEGTLRYRLDNQTTEVFANGTWLMFATTSS